MLCNYCQDIKALEVRSLIVFVPIFNQEGVPPSRSCDCGYMFHVDCLCEWLRSSMENRQSLKMVFGKCPYCDRQISCPLPQIA